MEPDQSLKHHKGDIALHWLRSADFRLLCHSCVAAPNPFSFAVPSERATFRRCRADCGDEYPQRPWCACHICRTVAVWCCALKCETRTSYPPIPASVSVASHLLHYPTLSCTTFMAYYATEDRCVAPSRALTTFVALVGATFGAVQAVFAYYVAVALCNLTDARALLPGWIFRCVADVLVLFVTDDVVDVPYDLHQGAVQLQVLLWVLVALALLAACHTLLALELLASGTPCRAAGHAQHRVRVWTAICGLQAPAALYMPALAIAAVCGEFEMRRAPGTALLAVFFVIVPMMLLAIASLVLSCRALIACRRGALQDSSPAYAPIDAAKHDCAEHFEHFEPAAAAMPPPPPYATASAYTMPVSPCGVCGEQAAGRARAICGTCRRVVCRDCGWDSDHFVCWPCVAQTTDAAQ